jgi:hypothetical protein
MKNHLDLDPLLISDLCCLLVVNMGFMLFLDAYYLITSSCFLILFMVVIENSTYFICLLSINCFCA